MSNNNFLYSYLMICLFFTSCLDSSKKSNIKEEYFDSGNIKVRAILEKGREHGIYNKFHKNGIIAESGIKIKGKMNGLWKYFDSQGQIISAKQYYNDSIVYVLDITDFNYVKREIGENLHIEIPEKWDVLDQVESSLVLLALRKECKKPLPFCPNLTVTYEASVKDELIDNYLKKSEEPLKLNFSDYRLLKERKYHFEGSTYFEKIYTGSSQGINIGGITTWIFDDENTYIITGLALNEKGNSFLKYEGLFKEIINSFEIK